MSNQFLRHQKREDEEKQQEMENKARHLLIRLNTAICKYHHTFEIIIKTNKNNGSIYPAKKVIKTKDFELKEATRFLYSQKIEPPQKTTYFFNKNKFVKEVEQSEKETGVILAPTIKFSQFGIVPSFTVAERRKNPDEVIEKDSYLPASTPRPTEGPEPQLPQDSAQED